MLPKMRTFVRNIIQDSGGLIDILALIYDMLRQRPRLGEKLFIPCHFYFLFINLF